MSSATGEVKPGQREGLDESAIDRARFSIAFKALRMQLNEQPLPVAVAPFDAEILRPEPGPTINIVLDDRRPAPERRRADLSWNRRGGLPRGLVFGAKIAAFVVFMAGLYYGPPYYTCRQLNERGMFFYGTTVGTCVQERLAARTNPLQVLAERVLPVL